ncbi:cupin domain-containing protein [Plesiomonas shigelloides]|uniref:AraC family transcriptional regulator n=1 Tax=Plesiomonas shigelloides TaxID=703 RepID=UPI00387F373A
MRLLKYTGSLKMDLLSRLLSQSAPQTHLFFAGNLCERSESRDYPDGGHLHLLRRGELVLSDETGGRWQLTTPTLVMFPKGRAHRLEPQQLAGCDLVCASFSLGPNTDSPLQQALPEVLVLPLSEVALLEPVLAMLFDEAFAARYGQTSMLSRLLEMLIILLLRYIVAQGLCQHGMLAALSDSKLAKAMLLMHERKDEPWTVASLAQGAGMSRARFAEHFQRLIGQSPLAYLTQLRMTQACQQLLQGQSVLAVALSNGYSSQTAFSRAFVRAIGMSPARWLKAQQAKTAHDARLPFSHNGNAEAQ